MIVALAVLGALAVPAVSAAELPAGWRADLGIPVELDDGTIIQLYGDTITDTGLHRQAVLIGDTPVLDPFATGDDRWYWPTDAVQLDDGSLLVAALEMREGGMLGYEPIDSDGFVVSTPTSPASWRLATKLEDVPWGDRQVQFSDQYPLAFVRDPYGLSTDVFEFADPRGEWVPAGHGLPESHGVFAPVQTADGWWGYTWEMWHTATLWHADNLTGPWTAVEQTTTELRTYDHGLNVVAGEVIHRWSNGEGSQRVGYRTITP